MWSGGVGIQIWLWNFSKLNIAKLYKIETHGQKVLKNMSLITIAKIFVNIIYSVNLKWYKTVIWVAKKA